MVVEDEAIIRTFITFALRGLGCNIIAEASYGEHAIETARNESIDIIFMDIRLKGNLNGIETARKISELNNAAIVFMSAYERTRMGVTDDFPNMAGYLVKPVHTADIEDIYTRVSRKINACTDDAGV